MVSIRRLAAVRLKFTQSKVLAEWWWRAMSIHSQPFILSSILPLRFQFKHGLLSMWGFSTHQSLNLPPFGTAPLILFNSPQECIKWYGKSRICLVLSVQISHHSLGSWWFCRQRKYIIPIVIFICAFAISTGGPQSGQKWRNRLKKISRLRFAALEMTRISAFIIHNWYKLPGSPLSS